MVSHLLIDGELVVRAAEEMIAQHGDSALVEADKKIRTGESEGFDYAVWKLIPCLSGYHPHPLYVVCLLGLQARAAAGALRRRSG